MRKVIFSLLVSALTICCFLAQANAELSSAEKDFLIQNQVSQDDINIIPKLSKETQANISAWIGNKDLKEMASFKNSRNYYKQLLQLEPTARIPAPPADWDVSYLTEAEFRHYADILSAPGHIFGK
jgi:hypothetical protein